METLLMEKLRTYIAHNNPDILVLLQSEFALNLYLEEKVQNVVPLMNRLIQAGNPRHVIEELCLVEMTDALRPSRFHFIKRLLKKEFGEYYERMQETGMLTYEVVQLISYCQATFERLSFSQENEDDGQVRAAITDDIQHYVESK